MVFAAIKYAVLLVDLRHVRGAKGAVMGIRYLTIRAIVSADGNGLTGYNYACILRGHAFHLAFQSNAFGRRGALIIRSPERLFLITILM